MSELEPNAEPVSADSLDPREADAMGVLQDLCTSTGLDVKPQPLSRHAPYLDIELVGDDVASTFGRHGQPLDSLQYLANLLIVRRVGSEVRVLLDACGYRARRAEALQTLALELAEQVKERQEECELTPLPAHERRIIHNTLLTDSGVRTYSEGDDPLRRVVIAPSL